MGFKARKSRPPGSQGTSFDFAQMVRDSGARMSQSLKERLICHPGELGSNREEIIREYLRDYLPKRFEISSGFAFDSHGKLSHQLDIIIADPSVAPRFEMPNGARLYPCQSILAVGQVKSSITSRIELDLALRNLESVKSLDRTMDGDAICTSTGRPLDPEHNHLHQIFTFVFVIGRMMPSDSLAKHTLAFIRNSPPHLWPNIIFALDKYMVTHSCSGGFCPNPMHSLGLSKVEFRSASSGLLGFYLYLAQALQVTSVARISYFSYLMASIVEEVDVSSFSDKHRSSGAMESTRDRHSRGKS